MCLSLSQLGKRDTDPIPLCTGRNKNYISPFIFDNFVCRLVFLHHNTNDNEVLSYLDIKSALNLDQKLIKRRESRGLFRVRLKTSDVPGKGQGWVFLPLLQPISFKTEEGLPRIGLVVLNFVIQMLRWGSLKYTPLWGERVIKLSHLLLTVSSAVNILIYSYKVTLAANILIYSYKVIPQLSIYSSTLTRLYLSCQYTHLPLQGYLSCQYTHLLLQGYTLAFNTLIYPYKVT